jgi:hypothetical protein
MANPRQLADADCWQVSGVTDAVAFFRALPELLPEATRVLLEGTPAPEIAAIVTVHAEEGDYGGPVGTLWSWPRSHRFTLRASSALFEQLAEAAARHAAPEICSHLHVYRDGEPLTHWFDAFFDPLLVSKVVRRERVEDFARATGGRVEDDPV